MRGLGRSQTQAYKKFARAYANYKEKPTDNETRKQLRLFDFDFKNWPIDFDVNTIEDNSKKSLKILKNRSKPFWISTLPCEAAAYIAVHTFGIRMIYPGSLKIIQSYLGLF